MTAVSEPTTSERLPVHAPTRATLASVVPYKPLQSTVPCLVLMAIAIFTAYSSVLFNFFVGDDFVHLVWLKDAIHNPDMVLHNFHASWLDVPTTKFYRPLISVFMLIDYAIWRTNGLGFHLTNVIFLLISSVTIFFIVRKLLTQIQKTERVSNLCPLLAALVFALYPLHPEPVSWITGRVDTIVTAFYLLSLWCYMRWRESDRIQSLALSLCSMVLALCSKEMAITLPALFLSYELFVAQEDQRDNWLRRAWLLVKPTMPFWTTLAVYFVVRRLSLGTFVGGYDDSLFFISDPKQFILGWLHGLHTLFVPVNRELMSRGNIFAIIWQISLGVCAAFTVSNIIGDASVRRRTFFLLSWFVIALAPVYKIFAIADDLQGSRLAYLATVPLACLIGLVYARMSISQLTQGHRIQYQTVIAALAYIMIPICAFVMLTKNNTAWAQAGTASNAIRQSLHKFYSHIPGDPQVLLIGLPDTIHGAYVARNALPGMTSAPQLDRDIHNCLMIGDPEQVIPFGYLRSSIPAASRQLAVLSWNADSGKLEEARMLSPDPIDSWYSEALVNFQAQPFDNSCKLTLLPDSGIDVQAISKTEHPSVVLTPSYLNCMSTDFLALHVNVITPSDKGADLYYENSIVPTFSLYHRTHADLSKPGAQTLLFPLHADPIWAFGGRAHQLKLELPRNCHVQITSLVIVNPLTVMPQVSFTNSGVLGTKGYAHLSQQDRVLKLDYSGTRVPNCKDIELEIARPNAWFEEHNTATPTRIGWKKVDCRGTNGSIELKRELFLQPGLYELRPWALDANGARVGVAGDHITISVDS